MPINPENPLLITPRWLEGDISQKDHDFEIAEDSSLANSVRACKVVYKRHGAQSLRLEPHNYQVKQGESVVGEYYDHQEIGKRDSEGRIAIHYCADRDFPKDQKTISTAMGVISIPVRWKEKI